MAVEILTVSLSDESVQAVADALLARLSRFIPVDMSGGQPTTQSNPQSSQNPQDAERPVSGQQGDPWMNSNGGQQNQGYQGPNPQYQQGPQQGQYQNGQQQQGGHNCAHGPMTFVPAGVNRNTNEPYNQYWKCPLQRGAQGRCRNVYQ